MTRAWPLALVLLGACAHANAYVEQGASITLYFGRDSPSGEITREAFEAFEDEVIARALTEGYTVLDARGRYREPDGDLISEPTFVLVVVFATEADARAASERIDALRALYCERFAQTSVLRVDSPARVSFTP